MRILRLVLTVAALTSLTGAARAAIVTYDFTGTKLAIYSTNGDPGGAGDAFSGSFSYDDSTPGQTSSFGTTAYGTYTATAAFPVAITFSSGSLNTSGVATGPSGYASVQNSDPGQQPDGFWVAVQSGSAFTGPGYSADVDFYDDSGQMFASTALPQALDLAKMSWSRINVYWRTEDAATGATSSYSYSGTMNTLTLRETAAVPEPAAWAMMALGFGLVGGTLRHRQGRGAPA